MTEELSTNELREQRIENMRKLEELGYPPFGKSYADTIPIANIESEFEEGKKVRLAGRLVSRRIMGKSSFAHIQENGCRFQVYAKKNVIGEDEFAAFKILDIGDIIGVEVELFVTRTGEQTLKIESWVLLSKSLLPLPEKWHGLQDKETRYRQRYVDLIANPDVMRLFRQRTEAISIIRKHLEDQGFYEVETPMLQVIPGGATARPFVTTVVEGRKPAAKA